ncbi:MAG: 6-bladed beta-propeller [Bacteroidales bacterium]|jgi:hypothetical protein|nr:6-bladed beta-propeller [Bacteroidales bacterium]
MKKIYIILSCFSLFVACSPNRNETPLSNRQIYLELTDDVQLSDSLEFVFIPLETNEQCLIGIVKQVEIRNGKIYVLDIKQMALFVFDMEGKFLTQIANRGSGPGEYITPMSFDFDLSANTIIVNDIDKKELLCFDLNDYRFKYTKALPEHYSSFSILSNHSISFFSSSGVLKERGEDYYVLTCDSLLNPKHTYFPADFRSGYSYALGRNFYRVGNRDFVYHGQIPVIYEIVGDEIKIHYELILGTFDFPPVTYLQEESMNNTYFVPTLLHSGYISAYMVCETEELLCVMFTRNVSQSYYGIYHKNSSKGYLYTANGFARNGGVRIPLSLEGATDGYIIGVLSPSFIGKPYTPNADLQPILDKLSPEDNPVLCLFKWKE